MQFRFDALALLTAVVLLGSGCVSTGTYQAKEQESQQLTRNLEECKSSLSESSASCAKLAAEAETLHGRLKKLDADMAALQAESSRLQDDYLKLKDESARLKEENARLAATVKPENLVKALANSLAELQNENSRLKLALENTGKAAKTSPEPLRITPDIGKPVPAEEKKPGEKPAPESSSPGLKPEPAAAAGQAVPEAAPGPR